MATVYLCEDIKHKRNVALKLLKPELAAVLGARTFGGWRGRKSALGTLASFGFAALVVVAYALRTVGAGGAP